MTREPTLSAKSKSQNRRRSNLNVYDILFVLFKHKWKIITFSLIGFAGASALIYQDTRSPLYQTTAKLLVRYVLERSAVDSYESKVEASGTYGIGVMDAEIEIIKSTDLALEVAAKVGPDKIVAKSGYPATKTVAAEKIVKDLGVTAVRGSNVIYLTYHHRDPEVAVAVLKQLIDCYFEKHLELHRSTGAFESVTRQTDQARSRLSQTEAELNKLRAESGFMSLADAKTTLEERSNTLRNGLLAAQVELAEQQAKVSALATALGDDGSKARKAGSKPAEEGSQERMARLKAQEKYRDLADQLTMFKQRRNTLLITRKAGDPMIEALDRQIASIQQQGLQLIEQHPGLANPATFQQTSATQTAGADLNVERANLEALQVKCKTLTDQIAKVDADMDKVTSGSVEFASVERRRQLEEEKYRYFETSLEKARVDEALNPASMANIGVVQNPSSPTMAIPDLTLKLAIGLASAGLLSGLALAFLIEWVIDRRVTRPTEIQARLQIPLMMTIPRIRSKDAVEHMIGSENGTNGFTDPSKLTLTVTSSNERRRRKENTHEHFITPYASALRDRIMFGFELNNVTHKPKMIGITALSLGAGTSTVAVGMAKAFAENGKFKVLLVDLNHSLRAALPDAPVESLDATLDISRSESFRKNPRSLYFASAPTRRNGKGAQSLAAVAMHELMPQLEVCDFDYIVFDMPVVAPTSPTIAIAGFMDKVLLVLDAENTNRESLSWSYAELEKGRADVSCVFNKSISLAPRWVAGEV